MDRSRAAAPALSAEETPFLSSVRDVPDSGHSTAAPLSERLEALRSAEMNRDDVTAFVEALTLPLAERETPRHRADVLLDVLEDEDLSGLTTHEGFPVGPAALEALQSLGFPYALEITPEMLVHAHQGKTAGAPPVSTARGVTLALLSTVFTVPLTSRIDTIDELYSYLGYCALLVAPALATALCRRSGVRLLHRLFSWLQCAMAGFMLFMAVIVLVEKHGLKPLLALSGALLSLLSTVCLYRGPPRNPLA